MAKRSRLWPKEAGFGRKEAGFWPKKPAPLGQKPAYYAGLRRLLILETLESRLTPAYAGFCSARKWSRLTPASAGFLWAPRKGAGFFWPKAGSFWPERSRLWPEKKPAFAGFRRLLFLWAPRKEAGFFGQSRLLSWPKEAGFSWPKAGSFPGQKGAGFRRLSPAPVFRWAPRRRAGSLATVRHLPGRQAAGSAPERCCFWGPPSEAGRLLRKTLLQRPTGTGEPAKAGFSRVFPGRKSRLLPALSEPARNGQKRLILPKRRAGPCRGGPEGRRGRILDRKRGFLTGFDRILSVLFGDGIGSSGTRFLTCSGTPFRRLRPESALFYPLNWPEPARTGSRTGQKVANIQPFLSLLERKTCFPRTFCTLFFDSGGPTHHFREEMLRIFSSFMTKSDGSGSLIKPT